jgi:HEAT repeat protein
LTLIPNPIAVVLLAIVLGAAYIVNVIGAEAYLLSVTQPVYALYAGVAGGVTYWAFHAFLSPRRLKFAAYAILVLAGYALLLASLRSPLYGTTLRAVVWLVLAMFAHRFLRLVISGLVVRHLDPARAQSHLSYLVATYDFGMACALIPMRAGWVKLEPFQIMNVTLVLVALACVFIAAQFLPASNFEIRFSHKAADPPSIEDAKFAPLVRVWCALALCMGAFVLAEQYLVRTVIKQHLTEYADIRSLVIGYKIVGNFGIAALGLVLAFLINRSRISPVRLLKVDFAVLLLVGLGCGLTGGLYAFVVFEVCRWVGENCVWFLCTSITTGAFFDRYRQRLSQNQTMFFYPIAGIPLGLVFIVFSWRLQTQQTVLHVLCVALLAICFGLMFRVGKLLPDALYDFVLTGHKTAAILAVNLLGFLRPRGYENELQRLLALNPKKLLRKNIILNLGYSERHDSVDAIIREFASDQEEIQIAVLDALTISRRYGGVQFMTRVTRAEVKPKTIRVRINAALALAAMYGKHSIPFLLHGLEDPDQRIVANTLETLAEFRDPELLPYFERFVSSPVQRVRANALMGLAGLRRTREEYRQAALEALRGSDLHLAASVLYVVGKIRDRGMRSEVHRLLDDPAASRDPSLRRCAAWALIRMRDPRGDSLFAEFLSAPAEGGSQPFDGFMHFFSQLPRETRMDLIRAASFRHLGRAALDTLEHALQQRTFDFHEELDYFYLLRARASQA